MKTAAKTPGPARTPGKPTRRAAKLPGEIRLIGGQWKRTRLPVPDRPGLRPTPDRVRETLFNWLGQDLSGWRCADVFAGTGALGFEAASRGAASVLMVEQDAALLAQLEATRTRLKASTVRIERGDGVGVLRRQPAGSLDLVFLDPPFDSPAYDGALQGAAGVLSEHGLVYLEAAAQWSEEVLAARGWTCRRHLKAGAVHAHLLARIA
ncbi:MAG: 16S rRNA (guanine(966)-N(2))-methyltransferase RsmD [Burkholderiaceae bacterium]|nr:16S rRNA (guanine(966)-N(2))-methyltransferase RsmD [Burkholderiaceae bacterium]MDO9090060.1 16S rRNA (guanine(966)-N(2))-methyltransferase RsmD [Burkholderiaceae bacterium]MDP1967595.1 16S rRNA (guanine(966)-N(2))-methyltransferase RsmD [Burkholderiaceae bacterium]